MTEYGLDEFGRYMEIDGTRYLIEPHPYWRFSLNCIYAHVIQRVYVLRWFWGTRHNRQLWKY